jgi:hypothetical protein
MTRAMKPYCKKLLALTVHMPSRFKWICYDLYPKFGIYFNMYFLQTQCQNLIICVSTIK